LTPARLVEYLRSDMNVLATWDEFSTYAASRQLINLLRYFAEEHLFVCQQIVRIARNKIT
jgi:hypothetical protein